MTARLALFPGGRPMEVVKAEPDPMVPGAWWSWRELPNGRRSALKWIPAIGRT